MRRFGKGQPVRRKEDQRFLTGRGRYTDDINLNHQAYAYVLRSPHAHARLAAIDAAEALAAPGVVAVFTGADVAADGLGTLPCAISLANRDGSPMVKPPRPVLARDRVRYVGDNVALVVADSPEGARDAAELVRVDYEPLAAVADPVAARSPGTPAVWDEAPDNVCFDWETGDRAACAAAFAKAHHRTRLELVNNRVVVNSIEPRVALGGYDPGDDRYTLYTGTQGVHSVRQVLAEFALEVPENRVRVITPDVGGGFGMKGFVYPEYALVLWAAKKIGRPVKWTGERSDAFVSDTHGRDHVTHAELALDADGRFLGLKVSIVANMGAYLSDYGPEIPTESCTPTLAGVYTTPVIYAEVRGVFTNTVPVDAYRGAGRPEAAYVVERLVDTAAGELGLDPAELRRLNFVRPSAMPYTTPTGITYDSGDFEKTMDEATARADWAGIGARRKEAGARGKRRGIGMATYIEYAGGPPGDAAEIKFDPSGNATIFIGTQSTGQGHETVYAQLAAEALGVPFEDIRVVQGDTETVESGIGTGGSRSLQVGGHAVLEAADQIVAKGTRIAAHLMEAAEADIAFADGRFTIAGTDRSVGIAEVARAAFEPGRLPEGLEPGLDETGRHVPEAATFPMGCHICEVEIDEATGAVEIVAYTVVDDFGRVINPLLVAGQVHGGVVQGIGQALCEHCVYDKGSGQLLTGSFLDYCMPRADTVPAIDFNHLEFPCMTNELGVKGCGEAGAVAAPPAVINAVVDALHDLGVRHLDMPATPERVWRAMRRQEVT
ncbi:MAG: xanthine dehydrogenase family protein molybdopterin-binding subunit [Alphaproteobacteria bacterium]